MLSNAEDQDRSYLWRHAHAQADRMADALLIASIGGGDLWARAQKEYIRRAPRPYMKIVSAIMDHDLAGGQLYGYCVVSPASAARRYAHVGSAERQYCFAV